MTDRSPRVRGLVSQCLVLAIAVGALLLAFRRASLHEIGDALRQVRVSYLLLSALVLSASYGVRGVRWRVLLSAERHLPLGTVFWANMLGYLGNNLLPARAGEVIRSALLSRRTDLSSSYILATALTERIMDLVALVLISLVAVAALPHPPEWLRSTAAVAGAAAVGGATALYLASHSHARLVKLLAWLPLPERIRSRLSGIVEQFLLGARAIHHPSRAASFAGLAVMIWLLDASSSILTARALSLSLSLPEALVLLAALGVASALPSTPGALGIFQLAAVTVLVPLGIPHDSALAYILVLQASAYIVVGVWAVLGLWRLGRSASPARAAPARSAASPP